MNGYIEIYDDSNMIGLVETKNEFPDDSVIELIDVTIIDKKATVMHILDMDYGIIIPDHIAEEIHKTINDQKK